MENTVTRQQIAEAYKLLGVSPEDSLDAIKKLYWRKSLAVHPHNYPDDPEAPAKLRYLIEAMDIIRSNHGKFSSSQLALGSSSEVISLGDVFVAWCELANTLAEAPSRFYEGVLAYWQSWGLAV